MLINVSAYCQKLTNIFLIVIQKLLDTLHQALPSMSLIASDFSYLPDVSIPGDRAPLVSSKVTSPDWLLLYCVCKDLAFPDCFVHFSDKATSGSAVPIIHVLRLGENRVFLVLDCWFPCVNIMQFPSYLDMKIMGLLPNISWSCFVLIEGWENFGSSQISWCSGLHGVIIFVLFRH